MKKPEKPLFYMLWITGIVLAIVLLMQPISIYLFRQDIALLFPKGPIGFEERNLLLIIQALMLIIIIPVFIFTFIFSWRYRADNKHATYDPDLVDNKIAELVWWGLPLVLVIIIGTLTWYKTHELDPYKPLQSEKKPLTIEVVALQWKWLFIYPEEKIATVNLLHIPDHTPIHFKITADAPMNSFWIPSLGGQIYAMPGMQTELNLLSYAKGTFRGLSANISGEGFAGMHFPVVSTSEEEFNTWIQKVKTTSNGLNWESYKEIALPSQNAPAELYHLQDEGLFSKILMKYMGH